MAQWLERPVVRLLNGRSRVLILSRVIPKTSENWYSQNHSFLLGAQHKRQCEKKAGKFACRVLGKHTERDSFVVCGKKMAIYSHILLKVKNQKKSIGQQNLGISESGT